MLYTLHRHTLAIDCLSQTTSVCACLHAYTHVPIHVHIDKQTYTLWMDGQMVRWMDGWMGQSSPSQTIQPSLLFIFSGLFIPSQKKNPQKIASEIKYYIKWELQKDVDMSSKHCFTIIYSKQQFLHGLDLSQCTLVTLFLYLNVFP